MLVRDVGLGSAPDPVVLEWAAHEGRILLSHDVTTMRAHAEQRVRIGFPMPGLILVPQQVDDMQALIDDLLLVLECSLPRDWEENPCRFLPFASS